jgi:hypothetical protein
MTKTPEQWKDRFLFIGEREGYTHQQITEYKLYIDLATQIINTNKSTNK